MKDESLIGRFALSLSGRDCGRILLILGTTEDGRLLVADGRKRKVENPKQKKRKHLSLLPNLPAYTGPMTNRKVWETVRELDAHLFG